MNLGLQVSDVLVGFVKVVAQLQDGLFFDLQLALQMLQTLFETACLGYYLLLVALENLKFYFVAVLQLRQQSLVLLNLAFQLCYPLICTFPEDSGSLLSGVQLLLEPKCLLEAQSADSDKPWHNLR